MLVAALAVSVWLHVRADFTFPLPWDDEISFLMPALNLVERGTLSAPELNPAREVFWMPPGYAVLCAALFKITGFSVEAARWFSWVSVAGIYLLLAGWLREFPMRWLMLTVLTLFFVSSPFVVAGNIARMDALALLFVVSAIVLLARGRVWSAAPLLAFSVLVHPLAAYFAIAALVIVLAYRGELCWRPARVELVLMLLAVVALGLYAIHIVRHWADFASDMAMQLDRKAARRPLYWLTQWPVPAYLALIVLAGALAFVRRKILMPPLALAASCLVLHVTGREMWYGIYKSAGWFLFGASLLWLLHDLLPHRTLQQRRIRIAVPVLAALGLLAWCRDNGLIQEPWRFPQSHEWWQMQISNDQIPYITNADRRALMKKLETELPSAGLTRIEFSPGGDALFFPRELRGHALPFAPRFTDTRAPIRIVHLSRHLRDEGLRARYLNQLPAGAEPFHQRDQTEKWFFIRTELK